MTYRQALELWLFYFYKRVRWSRRIERAAGILNRPHNMERFKLDAEVARAAAPCSDVAPIRLPAPLPSDHGPRLHRQAQALLQELRTNVRRAA